MRNAAAVALGVLALSLTSASAQTDRDRGRSAAQSVLDKWGSGDKMEQKVLGPMANGTPVTTIDGSQSFGVKMTCAGSQRFMRLRLFPSSAGDIQQLGVELDQNLDGSTDQSTLMTGPFAAVCTNGLVQCPSGTINNCQHYKWRADNTGVRLDRNDDDGSPNTQQDLGACYCINNACGTSLLTKNASKVLDDIGTGIALRLQDSMPRFAVSDKTMLDPLSAEFFGQQGGCGTDKKPEQYYRNPNMLSAAGAAAAADPNSDYYKVANSQVAQEHGYSVQSCRLDRSVSVAERHPSDIIQGSVWGTRSCGGNCTSYRVGAEQLRYWQNGGCQIREVSGNLRVNYSDAVQSAVIAEVGYDDWMQVRLANQVVWKDPAGWTGDPFAGAKCEAGRHVGSNPGVDVTNFFTRPADVELKGRVAVADKGDGWVWLNITTKPICELGGEGINDGCTGLANDQKCYLQDEFTDGVQTVRQRSSTGLQPLPSSRTFFGNSGCSITVERPWWEKKRTYHCERESSYDGEDAKRRYESVRSSYNPTTGTYTDSRKENGNWTSSPGSAPLMPPDAVEGCVRMCRTRKERPGVAVGEPGAVNQQNNTGPAYDYTYRECTDNVCPVETGETVVGACDCRNNFGEAAAMMQTIRQTQQDMLCQ